MAIKFACSCGRRFTAKDENAGKRSTCPTCGNMVVVPIPDSAVASDASEPIPPVAEERVFVAGLVADTPVHIPGLQASPDDDELIAVVSRGRSNRTDVPPSPPAFLLDPWYYYFVRIVGYILLSIAALIFVPGCCLACLGYIPIEAILLACGYAVCFVAVGAVILLLADVASNVRRLRLHADWDAGIR
jgi:hypothetical protein